MASLLFWSNLYISTDLGTGIYSRTRFMWPPSIRWLAIKVSMKALLLFLPLLSGHDPFPGGSINRGGLNYVATKQFSSSLVVKLQISQVVSLTIKPTYGTSNFILFVAKKHSTKSLFSAIAAT